MDKIERQSNIELLRIVAMFLVLFVHVNYFSLGAPDVSEISIFPLSSFFRIEFEALALVCVNVFVLISGYFGIKPKIRSIANFLFQIVFSQFIIYALCVVFNKIDFSYYDFAKNIIPQKQWFIWAYLGLMLVSPMLNSFVENTSKKELGMYLLIFFMLQFVSGWLIEYWDWYGGGYSTISFVGLYLLARYIKVYAPQWASFNRKWYLIGYLLVTTLSAFFVFGLIYLSKKETVAGFLNHRFMPYISLPTIIGSVCLLIYFSKLSIHSKLVNWIAASAFAAYLVHTNGYLLCTYSRIAKNIFSAFSSLQYLCVISVFVLFVFIGSILFDKIRLFLWTKIMSIYDKRMARKDSF